MGKWLSMGGNKSKPKKSYAELQHEIDELKKAKQKVKSYDELLQEKKRIQQEIRQEGFKMKHRKALSIINNGIRIGKSIDKQLSKK